MGDLVHFPARRSRKHPSLLPVMNDTEYELSEALAEIERHHRDFESISSYCMLVRNGEMRAKEAIRKIQNIVG